MITLLLLLCAAAQTLPAIEATTLAGGAVELPARMPAERTVLLLGFRQVHQKGFDQWRPLLASRAEHERVDWLELPFVDVGAVLGRIIGAAMDRQLDDPVTRAHFAPVWASADPVREALAVSDDKELAVVVCDRTGRVLWIGLGEPDDAAVAGLDAALAPGP